MKTKNSKSIFIKLIILAILGTAGIWYITTTPPTSEIKNYKKQNMATPYRSNKNNRTSNSSAGNSKNSAENDAVSLTGKKGRYEQSQIGKKQ